MLSQSLKFRPCFSTRYYACCSFTLNSDERKYPLAKENTSPVNELGVRRIRDNLPPQLSFSDRSLDGRGRGGWVVNLYNEPLVALVPEPDDERLLRVVHIPEHHLAVLVEGA